MTKFLPHQPIAFPSPALGYALLSDEPTVAVVFVHGFLGNSRTTWHDFQGLVDALQDKYPIWGEADLFFYDYPSRGQVKTLAEEFSKFLRSTFQEADGTVYPPSYPPSLKLPSGGSLGISIPRKTKPYKQLILVGHSTGALIIRESILQEVRPLVGTGTVEGRGSLKSFTSDASLRLFAPVHRGAMCSGPLGALFNLPVSGWLTALILRSNSLFMSLQMGSPVIEDLRRETEEFQERFPQVKALRACSLFGANDTVVFMGKYRLDSDHLTEPDQNHVSVCKPNANYSRPLEFVIDGIARSAANL